MPLMTLEDQGEADLWAGEGNGALSTPFMWHILPYPLCGKLGGSKEQVGLL